MVEEIQAVLVQSSRLATAEIPTPTPTPRRPPRTPHVWSEPLAGARVAQKRREGAVRAMSPTNEQRENLKVCERATQKDEMEE